MTTSAQITFQTEPESRFWIEGAATGTGFTCRVDSLSGTAQFGPEQDRAVGTLRVPVSEIDCGNRRMTADMRKTLLAESHPEIVFTLNEVGRSPVQAHGTLSLAGASRDVSIHGTLSTTADGLVSVTGAARLMLTDFGITPPTKFLGLVRVHNEIDVHFELIGARREPVMSAGF